MPRKRSSASSGRPGRPRHPLTRGGKSGAARYPLSAVADHWTVKLRPSLATTEGAAPALELVEFENLSGPGMKVVWRVRSLTCNSTVPPATI